MFEYLEEATILFKPYGAFKVRTVVLTKEREVVFSTITTPSISFVKKDYDEDFINMGFNSAVEFLEFVYKKFEERATVRVKASDFIIVYHSDNLTIISDKIQILDAGVCVGCGKPTDFRQCAAYGDWICRKCYGEK